MENIVFEKNISEISTIFGENVGKFQKKIDEGEKIIIKKYFKNRNDSHPKLIPILTILITNNATVLVLAVTKGVMRENYSSELHVNDLKISSVMETMIREVLDSRMTYTWDSLIYIGRIINTFIKSLAHVKTVEEKSAKEREVLREMQKDLDNHDARIDAKKIEFERERTEFNKRKKCQEELEEERAQLDEYKSKLNEKAEKIKLWGKKIVYEQKLLEDEKARLGELKMEELDKMGL